MSPGRPARGGRGGSRKAPNRGRAGQRGTTPTRLGAKGGSRARSLGGEQVEGRQASASCCSLALDG